MSDSTSEAANSSQPTREETKINQRPKSNKKPLEPLNLEGLSFLEVSQQLSSIDSSSPPPEDPLNTSDFFNSQGELVLSGMSQWSSDSEDDNENELGRNVTTRERTATDDNCDSDDDGSTASTDSIAAYKPNNIPGFFPETGNPTDAIPESDGLINKSVEFNHSTVSFGGEPSNNENKTSSQNDQPSKDYYWSEPVKDQESFRAVVHKYPNYGVRVYPGFEGLNVMNNSKSSGWRILPGMENEQIMSRAPNFRTPGGYKPPLYQLPPRDLTDAEITEEVRQMYAEEAERELESNVLDGIQDSRASSSSKYEYDDSGKKKTPVKRKLFKVDDDKKVSFVEPDAVDTKSPSNDVVGKPCTSSREDEVEEVYGSHARSFPPNIPSNLDVQFTGDISRCLPRPHRNKTKDLHLPNSPSRNSDVRQTNLAALDKLWRDIQETKQTMEADMRMRMKAQAYPVSPIKESPSHLPNMSSKNSISSESSSNKAASANIPKRNPPIASKSQRLARRGGKGKQMPRSRLSGKRQGKSPRQKVRNSKDELDSDTLNAADLESLELSSILQEAQLDESELDEILSEINDFPIPGHLMDEFESPVELTSALQQLQINDWAKSGASEYVDKFYEEKYRRQQCEKEILQVQKELLEQRERIAVLEGLLQSKEAAVVKHTKMWAALVKKWKGHEVQCKKTVEDLEQGQKELKRERERELDERKLRLGEYESELGKAISLTEEFKSRNKEVAEELQVSKKSAVVQQTKLQSQVDQLTRQMEEAKSEKEAMLRALRECQSKLDTTNINLEKANEGKLEADEKSNSAVKEMENVFEEAVRLKTSVSELENDKSSLLSELNNVSEQLKTESEEKERLGTTLKELLEAQAAKLHDYYNSKMHGILKTQAEKMITVQAEVCKDTQRKMKDLEGNANYRVREAESKFQLENEKLKKRFELEIGELKRENLEKSRLIGTVSRQLQSFENGNAADLSLLLADGCKTDHRSNEVLVAPRKSQTHGQNQNTKSSRVVSTRPFKLQGSSDSSRTTVVPVPTTNSSLEFASPQMQNCIAALVNAYKEKNS